MKLNIPNKRPTDNVTLSADFPQEDEFALSNTTRSSFYHSFYFPSINDTLYNKYVRFMKIGRKRKDQLKRNYHTLLVKTALNSEKEQIIVKNPTNTGKIKLLLEMYPNAKFIYIYRNPIVTYLSTVRFYESLLPIISLENYTLDYVKRMIITNYKNLIHDYFNTKNLIPKENLVEVRFEDFEKSNLTYIKQIYDQLKLETWDSAEKHFKEYVDSQKGYKKNKHKINKTELDSLIKELDFALTKLDYRIPDNIELI
jgi:hypothetical protein